MIVHQPKAPWMSPGGLYKGYAQHRFRDWRDKQGGQYSEDYFEYVFNFGVMAPGATAIAQIQIEADSTFEWISTTSASFTTGAAANVFVPNILIQVVDAGSSRNLFNTALPANCVCGAGTLTHLLPIPRRFLPKSAVTMVATNYDSAITYNTFQVVMIGRKIYADSHVQLMPKPASRDWMNDAVVPQFNSWSGNNQRFYTEDYYAYGFSVGNIASGATAITTVLVEADSDFEWITTTASGFNNATTGNAQNNQIGLQMQILDGGSQRNLFQNPVNIVSTTGTGQLPFILPVPRFFVAKTPIVLTLNNFVANPVNSIYVVLEGRKVFELD